ALPFEPSHLLIGDLALRYDQVDTAAKQQALLERLLPQVRAIPGVRAVSPVVAGPFSGPGGWDGKFAAEGQSPEQAAANPMLNMEVVTPDYFATLGIAVHRGRVFTDADREGAPPVVVISESVARLYWGTADPIGKRLRIGEHLERAVTVVGVVPDTRYRDLREARPSVYFPLRQPFFPFEPVTLAIRTTGPPTELVPTIRRVIAETEPGVAGARAPGRAGGGGAGATRRPAGEPCRSGAALRGDSHRPGDARGGCRAPHRDRGPPELRPGPVVRTDRCRDRITCGIGARDSRTF